MHYCQFSWEIWGLVQQKWDYPCSGSADQLGIELAAFWIGCRDTFIKSCLHTAVGLLHQMQRWLFSWALTAVVIPHSSCVLFASEYLICIITRERVIVQKNGLCATPHPGETGSPGNQLQTRDLSNCCTCIFLGVHCLWDILRWPCLFSCLPRLSLRP